MSSYQLDRRTENTFCVKLGRDEVGWVIRDPTSTRWRGNIMSDGTSANVHGWATAHNAFLALVELHMDRKFNKRYPACQFEGRTTGTGDVLAEKMQLSDDTVLRVQARNASQTSVQYRVVQSRSRRR